MRPLLTFVCAGVCAGLIPVANATPKGRDVGQLYADFCAGCHGTQLEGGKGPNLLEAATRRKHSDDALVNIILRGASWRGMPAFAKTVNDAEARALVAYMHEIATHRVDPQPGPDGALPAGPQKSELHSYRIETVADGLDVPWSLTFLPDDRILVTERVGRLRIIDHGRLLDAPVAGVPQTVVRDEAGMFSVVASPDFSRDPWVYLSFADLAPGDGDFTMLKIIRARLRENSLVDVQNVFSIPQENYQHGYVLYGGRLAFAGKYLYFSVGERGMEERTTGQAQDLAVPNGKIHRVYWDGTVPTDNPFVKKAGAFPSIWAYGVRNPQGLAVDPRTGRLWESEHGPRGGDELNHIERGKNYGWPLATYGMNYDGTPVSAKVTAPGTEDPVLHWTPSIAPSELELYTGNRFPKWKNNLFLGTLATQKLLRFVVDGDRVTHTEEMFKGLGRIRDIKTGPDGNIYLAIESIGRLGRVARIVPVD